MNTIDAWKLLEHEVNGRAVVGMLGVRDPEFPCDEYQPTDNVDLLGMRVTAPGDGLCDSDGHYLCVGCVHLSEGEGNAFSRLTDGRFNK